MRTIIAGSRSVTRYSHVVDAMDAAALLIGDASIVISGTAPGVDRLGEKWCREFLKRDPNAMMRSGGTPRTRKRESSVDVMARNTMRTQVTDVTN